MEQRKSYKKRGLVDSFLKNDIDELYDLKNDPGEMTNVIAKNPAVEKELKKLHLQWMAETKK